MLMKSVVGYGLAAVVAYICWIAISKFINEKIDEITNPKFTISEKCKNCIIG